MKKKMMWIAVLTLLVSLFGSMAVSAKEYKYRVTVYAGKQGEFSSGKVWTKEFSPGETVEISQESLGFKLTNDKYYPRGFRIAGHDNDEITGYASMSFPAEQDISYEMAYGLLGAMVKYTVAYQDTEGSQLRKTDTFYGMAGDKPVVSYRYVEGYIPNAYMQGKTLSEDESVNQFVFTYTKAPAKTQTVVVQPSAPGTVTNPAGSTGVTPAANASAASNRQAQTYAPSTRVGQSATRPSGSQAADADEDDADTDDGRVEEPDDTETIDESDVPLDQPDTYVDQDAEKPSSIGQLIKDHKALTAVCAIVLAALIALIIALILRGRNKENAGPKA